MNQNIINIMRTTTTTKAKTTQNRDNPQRSNGNNKDDQNNQTQTQTHHPVLEFEKQQIIPKLTRRQHIGSLRKLTPYYHNDDDQTPNNSNTTMIDFSSNDYLGLAQSKQQHDYVQKTYKELISAANAKTNAGGGAKLLGSTGSRLLTGNSLYATQLEQRLAKYHQRSAALLCNSGYDANLSVMSCLTINCYVIIDELVHNSIQMGLKLSKNCIISKFKHNNTHDLESKLKKLQLLKSKTKNDNSIHNKKPILIVVESIYSMDGDEAPLKQIFHLALQYNACIIVDEAHGLGVFGSNDNQNQNDNNNDGMGVLSKLNLIHHPSLLATVYTFGKGLGCHGAIICCSSNVVKSYLINYGRPIIYSTSLPQHSLVAISCGYETIRNPKIGSKLRNQVYQRIQQFRYNMSKILKLLLLKKNCTSTTTISLVESYSPIQALIIPGNNKCIQFCNIVQNKSKRHRRQIIKLYPIRSPTVPIGQERVRIIIHSHNTIDEINYLTTIIQLTFIELGLLKNNDDDDKTADTIIRSRL